MDEWGENQKGLIWTIKIVVAPMDEWGEHQKGLNGTIKIV